MKLKSSVFQRKPSCKKRGCLKKRKILTSYTLAQLLRIYKETKTKHQDKNPV